ncbi:MAG TPA: hypothetical protein VKR59_07825 [Terriglobales bacterium]|nr:hypothetical protein [Terriglobales bacterium]
MKERFIAFLKSTFSEADGSGSATRVLAGSTVASTLIWISYIVFTQHHLPDLSGPSLFVTAGFSGYAANKITEKREKP